VWRSLPGGEVVDCTAGLTVLICSSRGAVAPACGLPTWNGLCERTCGLLGHATAKRVVGTQTRNTITGPMEARRHRTARSVANRVFPAPGEQSLRAKPNQIAISTDHTDRNAPAPAIDISSRNSFNQDQDEQDVGVTAWNFRVVNRLPEKAKPLPCSWFEQSKR